MTDSETARTEIKLSELGQANGPCLLKLPDGSSCTVGLNSGLLHGDCEIRLANGGTVKLTVKSGVATSCLYTFKDGLEFRDVDWRYLVPGDRRFFNEVKNGIRAVGIGRVLPSLVTSDHLLSMDESILNLGLPVSHLNSLSKMSWGLPLDFGANGVGSDMASSMNVTNSMNVDSSAGQGSTMIVPSQVSGEYLPKFQLMGLREIGLGRIGEPSAGHLPGTGHHFGTGHYPISHGDFRLDENGMLSLGSNVDRESMVVVDMSGSGIVPKLGTAHKLGTGHTLGTGHKPDPVAKQELSESVGTSPWGDVLRNPSTVSRVFSLPVSSDIKSHTEGGVQSSRGVGISRPVASALDYQSAVNLKPSLIARVLLGSGSGLGEKEINSGSSIIPLSVKFKDADLNITGLMPSSHKLVSDPDGGLDGLFGPSPGNPNTPQDYVSVDAGGEYGGNFECSETRSFKYDPWAEIDKLPKNMDTMNLGLAAGSVHSEPLVYLPREYEDFLFSLSGGPGIDHVTHESQTLKAPYFLLPMEGKSPEEILSSHAGTVSSWSAEGGSAPRATLLQASRAAGKLIEEITLDQLDFGGSEKMLGSSGTRFGTMENPEENFGFAVNHAPAVIGPKLDLASLKGSKSGPTRLFDPNDHRWTGGKWTENMSNPLRDGQAGKVWPGHPSITLRHPGTVAHLRIEEIVPLSISDAETHANGLPSDEMLSDGVSSDGTSSSLGSSRLVHDGIYPLLGSNRVAVHSPAIAGSLVNYHGLGVHNDDKTHIFKASVSVDDPKDLALLRSDKTLTEKLPDLKTNMPLFFRKSDLVFSAHRPTVALKGKIQATNLQGLVKPRVSADQREISQAKLVSASLDQANGAYLPNFYENLSSRPFLLESMESISLISLELYESAKKLIRGHLPITDSGIVDFDRFAVAFNGGKDSTLLVHMLFEVLSELTGRPEKEANGATKQNRSRLRLVHFITKDDQFREMVEFFHSFQMAHRHECDILEIRANSMKACMEQLSALVPSVGVMFMGVRDSDPDAFRYSEVCCTSNGFPAMQLILPLFKWKYSEIWSAIDRLEIPVCSLYSRGFTSIGYMSDTIPNPELLIKGNCDIAPCYENAPQSTSEIAKRSDPSFNEDISTCSSSSVFGATARTRSVGLISGAVSGQYLHARELRDESLERFGRVKK